MANTQIVMKVKERVQVGGLIAAAKGYIGRPHPGYNDRMTSYSGSL